MEKRGGMKFSDIVEVEVVIDLDVEDVDFAFTC